MPELPLEAWQQFIDQHPEAHLLQSLAWGELKSSFSWQAHWLCAGDSGAQVLFRQMLGFRLAYIPKGPIGADWKALWPEVDALCRGERAIFLKVEPDILKSNLMDTPPAKLSGFIPSTYTIQPPRTLVINLEGGEVEVLGRMKQKTRYNIHLAQKKGVTVRSCQDPEVFHQLMLETGTRDEFGVHSLAYYRKAYDLFSPQDACKLLLAEYQEQPLAAVMVFRQGSRAWYLYGASGEKERNRMPAYLVQWEAMRWAMGHGCRQYDLWGVPDQDEAVLETQFMSRSDGLWGVYRFKRGFGGEVVRSIGAWDRVYQPMMYRLFTLAGRLRRTTRE